MLKNMKVGIKLLAILIVPLLVLAFVAAIGVNDRLQVQRDARAVEGLASYSADSVTFLQRIETEEFWSAVFVASGGAEGAEELLAAREASNEARDVLQAQFSEVEGFTTDFDQRLETTDTRLQNLEGLRTSVDELSDSPTAIIQRYSEISESLVSVEAAGAAGTDAPLLAELLRGQAALGRSKAAAADAHAYLAALLTSDPTDEGLLLSLAAAEDEYADQRDRFFEESRNNSVESLLRDGLNRTSEIKALEQAPALLQRSATTGDDLPAGIVSGLDTMAQAAAARLDAMLAAEENLVASTDQAATSRANEARNAVAAFLAVTIIGILIALAVAFWVARSIIGPLRRLTVAANEISKEKLPSLVERLRDPEAAADQPIDIEQISIESRDEIGQLAGAFNNIQSVTVEVAEEQSTLLQKGIGDIFVNLARRNQSLLDRQIEFIDELESNEEDPDQLENLFKLDHLATRMRRNAESLLVLAGAEPPRRRGRPVSLADVVRVAIGEVEDFSRISLLSLDEITVGGNVGVDLAHLLSELMENATQFSPPDTTVEVVGHRTQDGGYVVSVSDQGIGMSLDQMNDANELLANPPTVGLALSRSLGFTVVGRLAKRFDVSVRLTTSPSGGVTALTSLPKELVSGDESDDAAPPDAAAAPVVAPTDAPTAPELEPQPEVDASIDAMVAEEESEAAATEAATAQAAKTEEQPAPLKPSKGKRNKKKKPLPDAPSAEAEEPRSAAEVDDSEADARGGNGVNAKVKVPLNEKGLPQREIEPVEDASPVVAPVAETAKPLAQRPEPIGASPEAKAAPEAAEKGATTTVEEPLDAAPIGTSVEEAASLTSSGLVRRAPKEKVTTASGGSVLDENPSSRVSKSQRSPEEVRQMLSRYRSGLQHGKDTDGEDASNSEENA